MSNVPLKVDGFVFLTRDWEMLPALPIKISKDCIIEYANQKTFKGVSIFSEPKSKALYVHLNQREQFHYGIFVYQNSSDQQILEFTNQTMCHVRKSFYVALDKTLNQMKGSRLAKDKAGVHCCRVQRECGQCNICSKLQHITVYPNDFGDFGLLFHECLDKELGTIGGRSMLIVDEFGQSLEWKKYIPVLALFDLKRAEEAIIHIAMDFEQDNSCLLWKNLSKPKEVQGRARKQDRQRTIADETTEHEGDQETDDERYASEAESTEEDLEMPIFIGKKVFFCNLMAQGHCNTEVDLVTSKQYKEKEKTNMVHAAHYKLYSSFLKEIHRLDKDRWKTANVERSLCLVPGFSGSDRNRTGLRTLRDILSWVQNLEDLIEQNTHFRKVGARFEAIMRRNIASASQDMQQTGVKSTLEILEEFESTFKEMYPESELKKKLTIIPFEQLLNQLENTIIPAIQTLKPILISCDEKRTARKEILTAIPSYNELQLAVCAEMIISFAVYGKLNHFVGGSKERFSYKAVTALNLLPRRQCGVSIVTQPNEVFVGLRNVPHVEIVTNETGTKILNYTGTSTLLSKHTIWDGFINLYGEESSLYYEIVRDNFNTIYEKRNEQQPSIDKEIENIAGVFSEALRIYADKRVFGGRDVTFDEILGRISSIQGDVNFVNSLEFITDFFKDPKQNEQVGLAYLARDLEIQIGNNTSGTSNIKNYLANLIDNWLFISDRLTLIYPHVRSKSSVHSVILPFFGTDSDSYDRSSSAALSPDLETKQKCIRNLYMTAYKKMSRGKDIQEEVVDYVLLNKRSKQEFASISKVDDLMVTFLNQSIEGLPRGFLKKRRRLV